MAVAAAATLPVLNLSPLSSSSLSPHNFLVVLALKRKERQQQQRKKKTQGIDGVSVSVNLWTVCDEWSRMQTTRTSFQRRKWRLREWQCDKGHKVLFVPFASFRLHVHLHIKMNLFYSFGFCLGLTARQPSRCVPSFAVSDSINGPTYTTHRKTWTYARWQRRRQYTLWTRKMNVLSSAIRAKHTKRASESHNFQPTNTLNLNDLLTASYIYISILVLVRPEK